MRTFLPSLLLIVSLLGNLMTGMAQTPWRFSVLVGINEATSDYYGGFDSSKAKIIAQLDRINDIFNQNNDFAQEIYFEADSIYEFSGSSMDETSLPHSGFDVRLVINGVPNTGGGGFFGDYKAIHHAWSYDGDFGGPFDGYGTDGLAHEFGHYLGAVDLYGIQVNAENNPVNGTAYTAANSMMTYPYGNHVWDQHSIFIIDSQNGVPNSFPSVIKVKVTDNYDNPVTGAKIKLYPVNWYSYSVIPVVSDSGTTGMSGEFLFASNPFRAHTSGHHWDVRYANFLVEVSAGTKKAYSWMSIDEVQISYFLNEDFVETIQLDTITGLNPDYAVSMNIQSSWSGGFSAEVTISNNGADTINGWTLIYDLSNAGVSSIWNASHLSDNPVTVTDVTWNAEILPGNSHTFGANYTTSGTVGIPVSAKLNGMDVVFSSNWGSRFAPEEISGRENISIYPNPASDIVHLDAEHIESVTLTDINGRMVLKQTNPARQIRVSHLPAGLYNLRIETGQGIFQTNIAIR